MTSNYSHTPTPRREVVAAAILAERFQNPDVAAFNRYHRAKHYARSERRAIFWFRVGRLLGAAYHRRGCPTFYEQTVRAEIDNARASFAA